MSQTTHSKSLTFPIEGQLAAPHKAQAVHDTTSLILEKFDIAHEPMRFIVAIAQSILFADLPFVQPSLEIGVNNSGVPGGIIHHGKGRFSFGGDVPNPWTGLFVSPDLNMYDNLVGMQASRAIPFPDNSFNTICGTEIFSQGSRSDLLAEAWRVLAPGGTLAFAELSHEIRNFPELMARFRANSPDFECLDDSYAYYREKLAALGFTDINCRPHIGLRLGSLMHSLVYAGLNYAVGRKLLSEEPIYLEALRGMCAFLVDELSDPQPDSGWFIYVSCRKSGQIDSRKETPSPCCPECRSDTLVSGPHQRIECRTCSRKFEVFYGVPCLLSDEHWSKNAITTLNADLPADEHVERILLPTCRQLTGDANAASAQLFGVDPTTAFTIAILRKHNINVCAIGSDDKRLFGASLSGVPIVSAHELQPIPLILSGYMSEEAERSTLESLGRYGFSERVYSLRQGSEEEGARLAEVIVPVKTNKQRGQNSVFIKIEDASLRFRVYCDRRPALKESVIRALSKKGVQESVIEFDVLKRINLSLQGGDRLGVLGLNGAGKSTLLKMIVGIYPPHRGNISVQGKVTPLIELGTGFDYDLSGRENIYLNGSLLGRSYKQMRILESEIIEFSELGELIDLPIKYYSSGMLGRLAFSIGTIMQPEILIVDEIFATGDAHFVRKATDRMKSLFDNSQIVLLVTHDTSKIVELCNQAIVLHKGEIVGKGDPAAMANYYLDEIAV